MSHRLLRRRNHLVLAFGGAVLTIGAISSKSPVSPAPDVEIRPRIEVVAPKTDLVRVRRVAERRRKDAFVTLTSGLGAGPLAGLVLQRLPYGAEIAAAADRSGLDGLLVAAIVAVESSFDPTAVSAQGALGLMQVMPASAPSWAIDRLGEPEVNLRAGSAYMRALLLRFDHDLPLALAAYNAGPGAVERFGGIPPFRETQSFVRKVLREYRDLHEAALESPDLAVAAGS